MVKLVEHAADEAGGETFFSSDGLDPLPIPNPPTLNSNNGIKEDVADNTSITMISNPSGDILDSKANVIQPEQAFEIFRGHVFSTVTNSASSFHKKQTDETLLQRLARVQEEIVSIEADLKKTSEPVAVDTEEDEQTAVQDLSNIVFDLSRRLSFLSVQQRQKDLTFFIQKELSGFLSSNETKTTNIEHKGEEDKHEKFQDMNHSSTSFTIEQEQRLNKIETVLGSQLTQNLSNGINSNVMERLKTAERKLNNVDEKILNNAANRAKVIRADLEAAAKARAKINNSMASTNGAEDTKTIVKLHDLLLDLDGFLQNSTSTSSILSVLVDRMKTCAGLHSKASELESKILSLEQMTKQGYLVLHNIEDSVGKLECGMVSNMKMIEKNIQDIDVRL